MIYLSLPYFCVAGGAVARDRILIAMLLFWNSGVVERLHRNGIEPQATCVWMLIIVLLLYTCNQGREIGCENSRMRSAIICSHFADMQDMRNLSFSKKTIVFLVLLLLVNCSLWDMDISRRTDNNMDWEVRCEVIKCIEAHRRFSGRFLWTWWWTKEFHWSRLFLFELSNRFLKEDSAPYPVKVKVTFFVFEI